MSTTGHETVYSSDNPEEPTLFDMPEQSSADSSATTPLEQPVQTFDNTTLREAVDTNLINPLPDNPAVLMDAPVKNRNKWIAGGIAASLLAAGGIVGLLKAGSGESADHKTTPTAVSTATPGATQTSTQGETHTTAPATEATATPSASTAETDAVPHESYVPNITLKELTRNISQTRIDELLKTYPELANFKDLPARALTVATPQAITQEQNLVHSVYADPNMAPFLVNPDNPNDPEFQPWFTSESVANGSAVDSTAGNPIVAFPDFALRWATFFWDSNKPYTTTADTDKMVRMADLAPSDAQHYESTIASEGKQVGHAKAKHSDIIGATQLPDGRLFVGTVTEYEPGNGEPTGRVYVRWSVIAPVNGAIKQAPANADISFNIAENYLGNAPAN